MSKRIGVVSIIVTDRKNQAMQVNQILGQHGDMIIGRMGLPYRPEDIHVIALIVHGSTDEIGALTGKLGLLPGLQVKSILNKTRGNG